MIREACVDSLASALAAQDQGADRIELCSRLDLDGLTPDRTLVLDVCSSLEIPVMAMIRPFSGSFQADDTTIQLMVESIASLRDTGIHGVVFGTLDTKAWPHLAQTRTLVEAADGLNVTFHKAIDVTPDPTQAILLLKDSGIHRVLTSGGATTAMEGAATINKMQDLVPEISVIAAGKITAANIEKHVEALNVEEFHGKKIVGAF